VSPYAGTTRDVIEVHLDLGGWPVTLLDTAGIRETDDPVELEGVRRARERAAAADLVLWVVDAGASVIPGRPAEARQGEGGRARNPESHPVAPGFRVPASGGPRNDGDLADSPRSGPQNWLIRNKIDLLKGRNEQRAISRRSSELNPNPNKSLKNIVNNELTHKNERISANNDLEFNLSAVTGEGFDHLLAQLACQAEDFLGGAEQALVTRERHRHALEEVLAALRRAQTAEVALREDLLAEELRIAARALGRLTGRVDVEDILDVIFRDFCIGK
jgi:tRNA modification GTPase